MVLAMCGFPKRYKPVCCIILNTGSLSSRFSCAPSDLSSASKPARPAWLQCPQFRACHGPSVLIRTEPSLLPYVECTSIPVEKCKQRTGTHGIGGPNQGHAQRVVLQGLTTNDNQGRRTGSQRAGGAVFRELNTHTRQQRLRGCNSISPGELEPDGERSSRETAFRPSRRAKGPCQTLLAPNPGIVTSAAQNKEP